MSPSAPGARPAAAVAAHGLPPRVWIVGSSGSGKSTLAGRLAALHGVAPTSLDELHWEPGWVERSRDDLVRRLAPVVQGPRWIVEGNYAWTHPRFLPLADVVVWLDLPITTTVPRVFRRTVRRAFRRTPCCNGNRETLSRLFLRPDSIVLWAATSHRRNRVTYARRLRDVPHVRLRSTRAVRRFVDALEATHARPRVPDAAAPPRVGNGAPAPLVAR